MCLACIDYHDKQPLKHKEQKNVYSYKYNLALGIIQEEDTQWMHSNILFLLEASHENVIYNTGLAMGLFGFPAGA